jgi:hypothetical protein
LVRIDVVSLLKVEPAGQRVEECKSRAILEVEEGEWKPHGCVAGQVQRDHLNSDQLIFDQRHDVVELRGHDLATEEMVDQLAVVLADAKARFQEMDEKAEREPS